MKRMRFKDVVRLISKDLTGTPTPYTLEEEDVRLLVDMAVKRWNLIFRKVKGGRTHMKKSKGLTKNQKLKKLKTSKAKKTVKSKKK